MITGTNFHDGIEVYFGKARADNGALRHQSGVGKNVRDARGVFDEVRRRIADIRRDGTE